MSLRKNILLINLKIHSAYNKFFSEKIYTFDAYSALDIIGYLRGVHHKFSKHMVDIASGKSDDCFNLLDGNLQEITDEMLYIKKFKEGPLTCDANILLNWLHDTYDIEIS